MIESQKIYRNLLKLKKLVGICQDDIHFDAWTYFGFSTQQRCLFLLLQDPALTMARSVSLLPIALLALCAWMLSSLTSQSGFVMNSATPRGSKVAMRGFKDDFYAWKETLSSEDQALLLKQAQNASWLKRLGSLCDGAAAITFSIHWYTYSNYQNCACIGGWEVSF